MSQRSEQRSSSKLKNKMETCIGFTICKYPVLVSSTFVIRPSISPINTPTHDRVLSSDYLSSSMRMEGFPS